VSAEIVVVGDANVDLVLRGDVLPRFGQAEQLLDSADLALGGSGAIVACGLARLGHEVAIVAAVGSDAFGDLVIAELTEHGVSTGSLVRRDAATGISVILSADDRAILTYPGAVATLTAADVDPYVVSAARHVHVASPYLVRDLTAELPAVLGTARDGGATTSVDTNDDPARRWSGLRPLLGGCDVVLPNRSELQAWSAALAHPATTDWHVAAGAVAALGVDVVVKLGVDGGGLVRPDGFVITQGADAVEPLDTTGAGDSFDAGWISARLRGLSPSEALRWAVASGTLSTRRPGGTAGQPVEDQLRAAAAALP
jgi:ribokinase